MKVVVIVPCYNEATRLDTTLSIWLSEEPNVELLFVDDGSVDDTKRIINALAKSNDDIHAISLNSNVGKGSAIRTGVQWLKSKNYEGVISYLDADFSTSPEEALSILKTNILDQSKKVFLFGSRIRIMGREIDRKLARHYAARVFATIVSSMLNMPVYDSQCGFKAFTSDIAYSLFETPFTTSWFFDVELFFRSKTIDGINYVEEPLQKWRDCPGSKLKAADFLLTIPQLLRIYLRYKKDS
jgi:glycosyltransferase involved in cell wall biosynthesis